MLHVYRQFYSRRKTEDICADIAKNVETTFYTLNYELDKPLPKGKNKKSYWFNERLIRQKNNERIFYIKSKNLHLFNREQQ